MRSTFCVEADKDVAAVVAAAATATNLDFCQGEQ